VKLKARIGIDVMGSDNSPADLLAAAASLLPSLPSAVELIAIATSDQETLAKSLGLGFLFAREVIGMEENPLLALRRKKNSSLYIGLRHLKEGNLDAFVSAGNTGALISAAKMVLGAFPKILRPALLALMPTKKRPVAVLDVGANLELKAKHLIQFAHLGIAYQKARGIEHPRVGLLNIGSEASKGTAEIRLAYKTLQTLPSFAGNIEGKAVFDGEVDVLVTDGFTGNVFLKTAEGIASLVLDRLSAHIPSTIRAHLDDLRKHLHYAEYPGALLCGVKGTVVKCHGYSTPQAFANGIRGAIEFSSIHFIEILKKELEKEGSFAYPES
jgi:glycerol-3-phosphate acyltransferase PlsX